MISDQTIKEAQRSVSICYALEENVNVGVEDKRKLLELAEMIKLRPPCITAAGFFVVDRRVLFTILNITTTYFIVIIQFHTKSS